MSNPQADDAAPQTFFTESTQSSFVPPEYHRGQMADMDLTGTSDTGSTSSGAPLSKARRHAAGDPGPKNEADREDRSLREEDDSMEGEHGRTTDDDRDYKINSQANERVETHDNVPGEDGGIALGTDRYEIPQDRHDTPTGQAVTVALDLSTHRVPPPFPAPSHHPGARAARAEADRLQREVEQAQSLVDGLLQAQMEVSDLRGEGALTADQLREDEEAFAQIAEAKQDLYAKQVAAMNAADLADEAEEEALGIDHDHDDYDAPTTRHTLIYPADGTSTLPFPPSELPDPSVTNGVIRGARRWRFHSPPEAGDEQKCRTKFLNVLAAHGFNPQDCTITFPAGTGKDRYVQVYFKHHSDYLRAQNLSLSWNLRPLELAFSAAPMAKRQAVLKVNNVLTGGEDLQIIRQIFEPLSHMLKLESVWRLDQEAMGGKFTAEDIPGWTKTSNGKSQLHFLDRSPSCVTRGHAENTCPAMLHPAKRLRRLP
ncbi:uncharacterized protein UTRI_04703 [Ustilago trichophora]|uniref:Uncharacterized protein n=1 Tax=Ustilago trichophora TaxID=86804 RepID=A0A5C3EFB3_9BASI|nr:uncharacterized protein UTRI_04703 [Ustilago trichophora]